MDLNQLIPLLRANGVAKFKQGDLEIEFKYPELTQELLDRFSKNTPEPEQKKEGSPVVPPDAQALKGTDLMNEDAVLNWSTPQELDSKEPEVPLTGAGEP